MDLAAYPIEAIEVSITQTRTAGTVSNQFLPFTQTGRRSISSKHNKADVKSSSFTKSFANTKKEELMKVINEAKQKLENVSRPLRP